MNRSLRNKEPPNAWDLIQHAVDYLQSRDVIDKFATRLHDAEETIEQIARSDDYEEAVGLAEQYMERWTEEKK